jgi:hypothetical protein
VEALLIVVAIGFVLLLVARPEPETRTLYIPVEVVEESRGGIGCLPLIFFMAVMLLALASTQP